MLGVTLTAQRAGWSSQPAQAFITGTGRVGYEVYQQPAFSYKIWDQSRPTLELATTGQANLEDIQASITDNKGFVLATTFYMDWIEEEIDPPDENVIYGFVHSVNLYQPDYPGFQGINMFLQLRQGRLNITSRLEGDSIFRVTKDLPGTWQDFNNRWLTLVYASSEDPDTFLNYAPESGTAGFGSWNTRSCLFDTETGALIQKIDGTASSSFNFPGMIEWPQQFGDYLPVPFNNEDDYGIMSGAGWGGDPTPQAFRMANFWGSFGNALDPLQYGQEFTTARLSKTIDGVTAWYNITFTDYVAGTGSDPYYIPTSDEDIMTEPDDRAMDLTYGNDSTDFDAGYSTTIIPKQRNI